MFGLPSAFLSNLEDPAVSSTSLAQQDLAHLLYVKKAFAEPLAQTPSIMFSAELSPHLVSEACDSGKAAL